MNKLQHLTNKTIPVWTILVLSMQLGSFRARADLAAQLEAVIDQSMAAHNVPGAVVGIWRGNSPVAIFEKGVADLGTLEPMSSLDSFRIASVTKSFTVTRLLQLQDNAQLSLNDPIGQYVPGLQNGSATLRELANMTSGIFNYTEDSTFVNEFIGHPTALWTDQQLVDVANAHDPYFAPGSLSATKAS